MKGGIFNPTPIDRVNKSISNIRLTYKCYIFINLRTRHVHLTTFWVNIRGLFNPTLIDRVNKSISNNLDYHTNLTSYWVKIRGLFNPTNINRVNKPMTNNIRSTYRVGQQNLYIFYSS